MKEIQISLLCTILFGLTPVRPRRIIKSNKYKVMFCLVSQAGTQLSIEAAEHKADVQ